MVALDAFWQWSGQRVGSGQAGVGDQHIHLFTHLLVMHFGGIIVWQALGNLVMTGRQSPCPHGVDILVEGDRQHASKRVNLHVREL